MNKLGTVRVIGYNDDGGIDGIVEFPMFERASGMLDSQTQMLLKGAVIENLFRKNGRIEITRSTDMIRAADFYNQDIVKRAEENRITQENKRAPGYKDRQRRVMLGEELVWADVELIPLLVALNDAGLKTRSHCSGHETKEAFVAIRTDNVSGIEIRKNEKYNEIVIFWRNEK